MSRAQILTAALVEEADIIMARQRARQIAGLLGFEAQDQIRIATAVSEIARNATVYGGGGRVTFAVTSEPDAALVIDVRDKGPGVADIASVLEGRHKSTVGMGLGILGTRRLMDRFDIQSSPGQGTAVTLVKKLPSQRASVSAAQLSAIGKTLAETGATDPLNEARLQNRELLQSLAELKAKQDEADQLNAELENTNRGVVALYAELDEKAAQLTALNGALEERVEAAVSECQQANDALRQSQKMEAIGQLTGGVAHDFNNLLQIVTGNLELLERRLPVEDARSRRAVDNAMSGARRAATLTQRLLAFARRQPLSPKPIDANHLVEGMSELMRRTLGETITIDIQLAPEPWVIEADANQLENALLNLAVNARDAMPPGGTLTLSTANEVVGPGNVAEDAAPGEYLSVTVRDTGAGMSDETMSRVFEPFFTTKEVGKGTGLGLSMVYGFAKQSGGHVRIKSGVGRGTTVALCLPRSVRAVPIAEPHDIGSAASARAGEVILVVEDDPEVRAHTCDVLHELGYIIQAVGDGPAAIELVDRNERIDLVFTDVVLAGSMTGRDIADHVHLTRPSLPVLFTSGYARDAIIHDDRLDSGVELLAKPFTFANLATKVRKMLDGNLVS